MYLLNSPEVNYNVGMNEDRRLMLNNLLSNKLIQILLTLRACLIAQRPVIKQARAKREIRHRRQHKATCII
jgi:hypothetical protein